MLRERIYQAISGYMNVRRERNQLARLLPIVCDASSLIHTDEFDLASAFHSAEIQARWTEQARILDRLGIPDATGGVNPGDRRALFSLVQHVAPASVLEIGTHVGASTTAIALALSTLPKLLSGDSRRLVSVDIKDVNDPAQKPWAAAGVCRSPAQSIDEIRCAGLVHFVTSASTTFLRTSPSNFDLIFLDGSHLARVVFEEVPAAVKLLNQDGLIVLHDYFPGLQPLWAGEAVIPGPFMALERLRGEGAPLKVIPLGVLPWPTKLGTSISSLAVVTRTS